MTFDAGTYDAIRGVLPATEGPPPEGERLAAAVLIPLFGDDVRVVLTRRTMDVSTHKGQVAFPGGAKEPSDGSLLETALRESSEEIALDPGDVDVLGVLGDLPTAGSRFAIRAFVGRVPSDYDFVPDPREVDRVFTAPLAVFADESRRREEHWERDGRTFPVWFFDVDGEVVWGATARMLIALCDRLAGREPVTVEIPIPPR